MPSGGAVASSSCRIVFSESLLAMEPAYPTDISRT
jgi:hypothetical protein|tara:strand:+ start:857 stop:961 length:105 start_codon:yes stop_codon:yes gene_type:complete